MNKEKLISEIEDIIDRNMGYVLSSCLNDNSLQQLDYDIETSIDDIKSEIRTLIEKF